MILDPGTKIFIDEDGFVTTNPYDKSGKERITIGFVQSLDIDFNAVGHGIGYPVRIMTMTASYIIFRDKLEMIDGSSKGISVKATEQIEEKEKVKKPYKYIDVQQV